MARKSLGSEADAFNPPESRWKIHPLRRRSERLAADLESALSAHPVSQRDLFYVVMTATKERGHLTGLLVSLLFGNSRKPHSPRGAAAALRRRKSLFVALLPRADHVCRLQNVSPSLLERYT